MEGSLIRNGNQVNAGVEEEEEDRYESLIY